MKKTLISIDIPIKQENIKVDGVYEIIINHKGAFGKSEEIARAIINPIECQILEIESDGPDVEQDNAKKD